MEHTNQVVVELLGEGRMQDQESTQEQRVQVHKQIFRQILLFILIDQVVFIFMQINVIC